MSGNDRNRVPLAHCLTRWGRRAIVLLVVACADTSSPTSPTSVAAQIAFSTQPGTVSAGIVMNPAVQVVFEDADGKLVPSERSVVTLSIGTNPGGGTLSGTTTVAAVNGVATFPNLSIEKAGRDYTLLAGASGYSGVRSAPFDVVGGVAVKLVFTQQPSDAVVGEINPVAVQVTAQDAAGNTASGFNGIVTVTIGSNPGTGTLAGTASVAAVNGIATFSTLSIDQIATGYTLTATALGLSTATSAAFAISRALGRLVFTVQPSSTAASSAFSPAIAVAVQDTLGNLRPNATNVVTLAIGTNPTGGTLAGTVSVAAVSGVATFGNVKVNKKGSGYTLTAAASGFLSGATSATFNIAAGPAARLAFAVQPSNANVGATIAPPVQVTAFDAQGDTATGFAGTVTLAIGTSPGGFGTLSGTTTQSAVAGLAAFSDLSIQQAGTGYTLAAGSAGLSGATSASFNIAPVPTVLHITTASSGANIPGTYEVSVDCDSYYGYCLYDASIGANSAVTLPLSYPGTHTVQLGIPSTCIVSGDNPRSVNAVGFTEVPFSISCAATGSVHVTVATAGTDIDPDGYTICVDGPSSPCYRSATTHANDVVTIGGVFVGSHTVSISGIAGNCTANGGTTRAVTVPANGTSNVSFGVTCALSEGIAFSSGGMITVIRTDGSAAQAITSGFTPAWSPDGAGFAYECAGDICAINGDGTGFSVLTMDGAGNHHPTWSPDGLKIAFASTRGGTAELWVMAANGSGAVQLTQGIGFVGSPAWSPDGTRIVFDCQVDAGNDDLCAVNADGTGFARLTNDPGRDYGAAWKPDGSLLAFATTRYGADEIVLMSPTGGGVTRIGSGFAGFLPTWSSDGTQLAFVRMNQQGARTIVVAHADGSNPAAIASGDQPAWKPHH